MIINRSGLEFGAKHGDYIIGGDDTDEFVVLVDDGEGDEIVFVEKFGDFVVAGSFVGGDERFGGERQQRRSGFGEHKFRERDGTGKSSLGVDQVDGAHGFHAAFEFAENADGIFDAGRDRQSEELSGHAAGGGLFAVL